MGNLSLTRIQYAVGLGLVIGFSNKLHPPIASLVGFAIASILTSLRNRAVGRGPARAFAPLAIATLGSGIQITLSRSSASAAHLAAQFQAAAIVAQFFVSLGALVRHGVGDPTSPKQELARSFLRQRRRTKQGVQSLRHQMQIVRLDAERLKALSAELAASAASDPSGPGTAELRQRVAAQSARLKEQRLHLEACTQAVRGQSTALRDATDAWKNRDMPGSTPGN